MDKQTATLLAELHEHLQCSISEHDRQVAEQLRKDVASLLAHSGPARPPSADSIRGNLDGAVQRFEVSNPELTEVLSRVINALTNLGI